MRVANEIFVDAKDPLALDVYCRKCAMERYIEYPVKDSFDATALNACVAVQTIHWDKLPWHTTWWAKLLRKMMNYLPLPLRWLANGDYPIRRVEYKQLPNDTLKNIVAQIRWMKARNEKPSIILIGTKANFDLTSKPDFNMNMMWNIDSVSTMLFGLPIKISPWLKEDDVIVG